MASTILSNGTVEDFEMEGHRFTKKHGQAGHRSKQLEVANGYGSSNSPQFAHFNAAEPLLPATNRS